MLVKYQEIKADLVELSKFYFLQYKRVISRIKTLN